MKEKFYLCLLSLALVFQSCNSDKEASPAAVVRFNNLIPKPVLAELGGKTFSLTESTKIVFEGNEEIGQSASFLVNKLNPSTGFNLNVSQLTGEQQDGSILLTLAGADATLGDEGYELIIEPQKIKLTANKPSGLYMGVQTLRLLLPEEVESPTQVSDVSWEIATGTIRDSPIYSWRGSMLDVARHFLAVEDVKRYIDMISLYKMNVLHLHLSDDQGWRIEIKSWPNLALYGGKTQVGGGDGGYYTQEQYKSIVDYAKSKYITIVPEIDLPGHINSALASYGVLNGGIVVPKEGRIETATQGDLGKDKPTQLYTGTEVGFSTLSLSKPSTFKFVEDVIRELSAITPGNYIHIGGDEAHVTKNPIT